MQGPGNLKTTSDLQFPAVEGLSSYPAAPVSNYLPNTTARSYKVFKTVLVPNASGTYTLPALSWSYFDPQARAYKTLVSQPLSLVIAPSSQTGKQVNFSETDPAGHGVQTIGQDIRYIRQEYAPVSSGLSQITSWKWLHLVALTWLGLCLFIALIGRRSLTKHQAFNTARTQLKKATTHEQISEALSSYLLAKWNISTASLPLKDIVLSLEEKHVSTSTCQQFATLWKELESVRFAPIQAANTLDSFTQRASTILKMWEEGK